MKEIANTINKEATPKIADSSFNPDKRISVQDIEKPKMSNVSIENWNPDKRLSTFKEQNLKEADSEKGTFIETKTVKDSRGKEVQVPIVEKTVINDKGEKITEKFPEFPSKFDVKLPDDMLQKTDNIQKTECNRQLKEAVQNNPEIRKQFTQKEIEQILDGKKPKGYVWHHHEDVGKMQLVDENVHRVSHIGGSPNLCCFDLESEKEKVFENLFSFNKDDVENIFDAQDFDTQINSKERVLFPFANDSFGNLFCLHNNKIVLWEHEEDSITPVADTWSDFLRMLY